MKKNTVVQLTKFYKPFYGGIESVTEDVSRLIIKKSWISEIVCFSKHKHSSNEEEKVHHCNFTQILSQPLSLQYFFKSIQVSNKSDLVIIHLPNYLALLSLLFIKTKKLCIFWHSDVLGKGIFSRILQPLVNYSLKRSEYIIVSSKEYSLASKDLKDFQHKLKILKFTSKKRQVIESKYINSNQLLKRKFFLSVGRLVKYKGFDYLIKAAKEVTEKYPGYVFVIIGSGHEEKRLKKLVRRLNLEKNIVLLNNVSDEDIVWFFKNAYAFVLSSVNRAEAYGIVLVESLSYGLPIISFKIPGSGAISINLDNYTGLVSDEIEPKGLSQKILSLIESPELRKIFSRNASAFYKEKFSQKVFSDELNIVLSSMLD